jgi:PAS domain S-box-containing protein
MNKTKVSVGSTRRSNSRRRNETNRARRDQLNQRNRPPAGSAGNSGRRNGASEIVTEREQAERAQARLAAIVESSDDAIISKDLDGIITSWNRGAKQLFGYTAQEVVGQPVTILMPPDRVDEEPAILKRIRRGESVDHYQTVRRRKDGRLVNISLTISPIIDANGEVIGASKIARDITAYNRAKEELELISRLPEENPEPVVRLQQGRVLSFANPAAKRLLSRWKKTLGDQAPARIRNAACAALAHGNKRNLEIDSGNRSYTVSVCPVQHANYVNLYFTDVTDRRRVEDALERSTKMLEKLVRQRTKALRTANTELQNEISHRKGLEGQILEISDREQERLGQELHDGLCQQLTAIGFLARATALRLKDHRVVQQDDLERIAQLINSSVMDARNIARDLHKEEIDAAEFLPALRDMVDRKIWKIACRLDLKTEVNIEDDNVASQLYRILREALINANKHARATQIVLTVRRLKNDLVFSVTDNGVGLNPRPKAGHGLGFHIMNYRAESIGARLELKSLKKRGTRVACYLPMR